MSTDIIAKFNLPPVPKCKIPYQGKDSLETDAIFRSQNGEQLSPEQEEVLREVVDYYEILFPMLKSIDLASIIFEEGLAIQNYLDQAVNYTLLIRNDMTFDRIFRISVVEDSFREKGKVRSTAFLKYPPLGEVKKNKRYNRANTFNKTVFYAAPHWHVALLETKPKVGQKVIMSVWEPCTDELFNSYPIANIRSYPDPEMDVSLRENSKHQHPLHNRLGELIMDFLVTEFVKDVQSAHPNKLEYLFSAYFSECILGPIIADTAEEECDLIRYPTVAFGHKLENIAMNPHCLDSRMEIVHAIEYEVEETYYDQKYPLEITPAKLKFIREASWFDEGLIVWND